MGTLIGDFLFCLGIVAGLIVGAVYYNYRMERKNRLDQVITDAVRCPWCDKPLSDCLSDPCPRREADRALRALSDDV